MNNNGNFNHNADGQQFNGQPMNNGQFNNQQQYNPQFNPQYNQQQYNQQQYNPQFNQQPMNNGMYNQQPMHNGMYNQQPAHPHGPKAPDGKAMSVTALVLGICSAFFSSFLAAAFPVSLLFLACGVVGIILAVLGRKKSIACYGKASGMATAGLVLSIIGTTLSALFIVSCLACIGCAAAELNALSNSLR